MLNYRVAAVVLVACSCSAVFAEMTTRERLKKFGDELSGIWEKFPTEAQKVTRTQTSTDLNASFQKEITVLPTPNEKIGQIFKHFLADLDRANELFRLDKMSNEKKQYIQACQTTFRRESQKATDFAETRTTQQAFDLLLNMLEQVRDEFVQEKNKELRQQGVQAANQFFTDILKSAKIPENMDHAKQMDLNMKEIKNRFPTTTKALSDKNQGAYSAAETAAKQVKQKNSQVK
jgi:hypothetical protein